MGNIFKEQSISKSEQFCNSTLGISVLVKGYTYSYVYKESRNGEKCCRPIKSKCHRKNETTCKIMRGQVKCGKGCARIIKALEKLQGKEKEKKRKKKKHHTKHRDYEKEGDDSFEEYDFEEYSYEEKDEEKVGGGGGLGLKVKKGQKMSQKQLQMLETAAEEKKTSTNPLCKQQNNLFRCVTSRMPNLTF